MLFRKPFPIRHGYKVLLFGLLGFLRFSVYLYRWRLQVMLVCDNNLMYTAKLLLCIAPYKFSFRPLIVFMNCNLKSSAPPASNWRHRMKKLVSAVVAATAVGLCLAGRVAGAQTVTNAGGVGLAGTVETYSNPNEEANPATLYTVPSGKWFAITQVGNCSYLTVQNGIELIPNTYTPAFIVPAGTAIVAAESGLQCWVTGILG